MRTNPISSDDPNAIQLLQTRLAELEAAQTRMKAANEVIRHHRGQTTAIPALVALGIDEADARALLRPDFLNRIGYPRFELTNNASEIRRITGRIEQVSRLREEVLREWRFDGMVIAENAALNRLQIRFNQKPDEVTRAKLRRFGFVWAPSEGAWQRKRGPGARLAACDALGVNLYEHPTVSAEAA